MSKTFNLKSMAMLAVALGVSTTLAGAAVIAETFETTTPPAVPTGWQVVGSGVTTAANGNPGNSVNAAGGAVGYLVNAGVAFDATQAISGTFDFYIAENGNYSNGAFYIGDVQDGLTGTSAGEFLRVDLREKTFGARANILDGAGTTVFNGSGNNLYEIVTNQWNSATFTWTPTSGTTGNFSFSWVRPTNINEGPMTVTGYTFDSSNVFFGFGTADDPARFDNINITGTEIAVPEPASIATGLFGIMLISLRRR